MKTITFGKIIKASSIPSYGIQTVLSESFRLGVRIKGISKNPYFYDLNPSPFSGREGYKEFLEMPLNYLIKKGKTNPVFVDEGLINSKY